MKTTPKRLELIPEERRSGVQSVAPVAPAPDASLEELHSRYVMLLAARESDPGRLTEEGLQATPAA